MQALRPSQKRFSALEFISRLSKESLELSRSGDLYPFIAQKLLEVAERGAVVLSSCSGEMTDCCIESVVASDESAAIRFGEALRGKPFRLEEEVLASLRGGKVFKFQRNKPFSPPPWCQSMASVMEERLGPLEIYALGFGWEGHFFGHAVIIAREGGRMKNRRMLETFAMLASVAIRRRQTEVALQENEAKYRQLVEHAPSGIYELDLVSGKFVTVNDIMCEYTGYSKDEFLQLSPFHILTDESKRVFMERLAQLQAGRKVSANPEFKIMGKNGREFWVILNARHFWEGGVLKRATVVVHDITEIKAAQKALKESETRLHMLSSQLMKAQEEERKRVAQELHDQIGQDLMALKLHCRTLQKKLQETHPDSEELFEEPSRCIKEMAENIRRLSQNLTPRMLEDFGLVAALRWLVEESAKLYQIEVITDVDAMAGLFPREKEIVIYRLFQEAINNVGKHAHASRVNVSARVSEGLFTLTIEDNGEGFDVKEATERGPGRSGFGITTMQERARMLGGVLQISGAKGLGSVIRLEVPLQRESAG